MLASSLLAIVSLSDTNEYSEWAGYGDIYVNDTAGGEGYNGGDDRRRR